jgi:hypothetical protein
MKDLVSLHESIYAPHVVPDMFSFVSDKLNLRLIAEGLKKVEATAEIGAGLSRTEPDLLKSM